MSSQSCLYCHGIQNKKVKKERKWNSFVGEGDFVLLSGIKSSNPVPRNTKRALKVTSLLIILCVPTFEAESSAGVWAKMVLVCC